MLVEVDARSLCLSLGLLAELKGNKLITHSSVLYYIMQCSQDISSCKKTVLCLLTFTLKLQPSQILLGTEPPLSAC